MQGVSDITEERGEYSSDSSVTEPSMDTGSVTNSSENDMLAEIQRKLGDQNKNKSKIRIFDQFTNHKQEMELEDKKAILKRTTTNLKGMIGAKYRNWLWRLKKERHFTLRTANIGIWKKIKQRGSSIVHQKIPKRSEIIQPKPQEADILYNADSVVAACPPDVNKEIQDKEVAQEVAGDMRQLVLMEQSPQEHNTYVGSVEYNTSRNDSNMDGEECPSEMHPVDEFILAFYGFRRLRGFSTKSISTNPPCVVEKGLLKDSPPKSKHEEIGAIKICSSSGSH